MTALQKEILRLCMVEAEADGRRAEFARIVRDARRKRAALLGLPATAGNKKAPDAGQGARGRSAQHGEAHNLSIPHGAEKDKRVVSKSIEATPPLAGLTVTARGEG